MPDFNIVPEIGGVDTSDPARLFDCDEQEAVIRAIFGDKLLLPDDQTFLEIERRKSEKGFSTSPGKVYTPNDSQDRILLAGSWADIDEPYEGFLAVATKSVLNAGRMIYLEQPNVLRTQQSTHFRQKGEKAAKGVIAAAGLDDYRHPLGIGPMELNEIGQWLAIFAGHERGQVTTLATDRQLGNPYLIFGRRVVERIHKVRAEETE